MRLHSGSRTALVGALLITGACAVHAQDSGLRRSMEIMAQPAPGEIPAWLIPSTVDGFKTEALRILQGARAIQQEEIRALPTCETPEAPAPALKAVVFASWSLPKNTLNNYMARSSQGDVLVLFRGIGEGDTLKDFYLRFVDYAPQDGQGDPPNVALDPTWFTAHSVTVAPTIVALRDGQPVARATGDVSVDWVIAQGEEVSEDGAPLELGQRGEVHEIAERDLIEEMQDRVLAIDWDAKRKAAIAGFWDHQPRFVALPVAEETRTWEWQSTFVVPTDIVDHEGRVLVPAGHTYSPFDQVPLPKTIIIFDAQDEEQVALVRGIVEGLREKTKPFVLITTRVDRSDGWQFMSDLEQGFLSPVYVLYEDLAKALGLKAIPSVVRGEGSRVFITEIPPSSFAEQIPNG